MIINLFNFSKRFNSTLQPSDTGVELQVKLKEGTSIYNPSFLLTGNSLISYNYVKWEERYYFINDIRYTNSYHLIELDCNMDYLATFKDAIKSTSAFITYSSSDYDASIPDRRLSTIDEPIISSNSVELFDGNVNYFISYIGSSGAGHRMVTTAGFNTLSNKLADPSIITAFLNDPNDYFSKSVNSATDSITEAHMLPFSIPAQQVGSEIILGANYHTGVTGFPVSHFNQTTRTLAIPWNFADFRNRNGYTSIYLYLPAYGIAQLNPDDFIGKNSITITITYDPYDGGVTYRIGDLYKFNCSVAIPVQIGTVKGSNVSMLGSLGSLGLAAATGNLALAVGGLFNVALSDLSHQVGSIGSNGGGASYLSNTNIVITVISHSTTVGPSSVGAVMGRPLNQVKSLSGLTGYVQCVDASVSANAPDFVITQLNSLLNGGVYIE